MTSSWYLCSAYCMHLCLSFLGRWSHLSPTTTLEWGTTITPILQMSKLTPRELNWVAWSHTANREQSQDSTPGYKATESGCLTSTLSSSQHASIPSHMRAPIHPVKHACIHSGSIYSSAYYSRHSGIGSEWKPTPQSPACPSVTPAAFYCAQPFQLAKNRLPVKPGLKCSCSRPQTAVLLGNHKPTPLQKPFCHLLRKGWVKMIDPVYTSG